MRDRRPAVAVSQGQGAVACPPRALRTAAETVSRDVDPTPAVKLADPAELLQQGGIVPAAAGLDREDRVDQDGGLTGNNLLVADDSSQCGHLTPLRSEMFLRFTCVSSGASGSQVRPPGFNQARRLQETGSSRGQRSEHQPSKPAGLMDPVGSSGNRCWWWLHAPPPGLR